MQSITIGEIAQRIAAAEGEDVSVVTERLRNWAKEGLLKSLGAKHPGTGRRRRYHERTLIDAAILSRLATRYGAWAPRMAPLFDGVLDRAFAQLPKAKYIPDYKDIYLIVAMIGRQGDKSFPLRALSDVQLIDSADRARPAAAGLPDRRMKIPERMTDGLFINLTALFNRLGVPFEEAAAMAKLAKRFPGIDQIRIGTKA